MWNWYSLMFVMDMDFDGCMGRLQNVCHKHPVYCFLQGAVCKKPQTYR